MPTRKLPPDREVLALYRGGMSYSAIATMYGTGKPAVGLAIRRAGGEPRSEASGYMPSGLLPDHWHAPAARHLRELSRREKVESSPDGGGARRLRPAEEVGLNNWLAMLAEHDWVVAYDPDHEPNPASPTHGGWYYVPRPANRPTGITAYDPA